MSYPKKSSEKTNTKTWTDLIRGKKVHRLNQLEETEANQEIKAYLGEQYEDDSNVRDETPTE